RQVDVAVYLFFSVTAATGIYPFSRHDALPIFDREVLGHAIDKSLTGTPAKRTYQQGYRAGFAEKRNTG
ncbi:hypothetical protein, partial [Treponema endosymbiont of Eucomonympha sp.]|uniref:hypothetical protein n=1 Tax=Treponema endosymbiont of Eucomonympha sp. TaxID=1580831 RepID=UPI000A7DD549